MSLIVLCGSTGASEENSENTLHISADDFRGSLDSGAEATGNVVLRQGALHLSADNLTLQMKEGIFTGVEANGAPVEFQFQIGEGDSLQTVQATAKSVVYKVEDRWIEFSGDAEIESEEISIEGDKIQLDLQNNRIEAESISPDKQVEITIHDIGFAREANDD